ncbi:hypothetical protein [Pseudomonas indica]|nr:hypothetical protein [Pseudomonas indica]
MVTSPAFSAPRRTAPSEGIPAWRLFMVLLLWSLLGNAAAADKVLYLAKQRGRNRVETLDACHTGLV